MILRNRISRILMWLTVIALGVLLGGNTYEQTFVNLAWQSNLPGSLNLLRDMVRVNGLPFYPLVMIPAIVCSLLSLIFGWRGEASRRKWLIVAAACAPLVLAATIIFFAPVLSALFREPAAGGRSLAEVKALAFQFKVMSWIRWSVVLCGFLASMRALTWTTKTVQER